MLTRRRRLACALAVALAAAAPAGAVSPAGVAPDLPTGCETGIAADRLVLARTSRDALDELASAARAYGGRISGGVPKLSVVEIAFPTSAAARTATARLAALPGVEWAQGETEHRAARTSNDPLRRYQWGLKAVNAYAAWDRETGSRNRVTVAVLDTGIDYGHPDLAGRTLDGPSSVGTATSRDDEGHGTLVAGVIGAVPNNRTGVAGLSWAPRLLSVKVLNSQGSGTDCSVVNGYLDAVDQGASVVNMSLAAAVRCPVVYSLAMQYGEDHEVVTVAAAGNEGADGNPEVTPASCTYVLAVGAYDERKRVADFSGYQPYVALAAPGVNVVTTWWDAKRSKHAYGSAHGTSLASPFVAGVAALVRARHGDWTAAEVRDRLTGTARDLGAKGRDHYYGFGSVDAARAVAS